VELALDARLTPVSGSILDKGAALPANTRSKFLWDRFTGMTYEGPSYVLLTDEHSGWEYSIAVSCTSASGWQYAALMPPGRYRVQLRSAETSHLAEATHVPSPSVMDVGETALVQPLDLNLRDVSITLLHNGATITDSQCSYSVGSPYSGVVFLSYLSFLDAATETWARLPIGCSSPEGWTVSGKVPVGRLSVTLVGNPRTMLSGGFGLVEALEVR
jgi:hypothetical protein